MAASAGTAADLTLTQYTAPPVPSGVPRGLVPQGLESFALAITFGLLNAAYTTILICAPFW